MAVQSNVRARRYTGTGACGVGRARINLVVITVGAGAGRLTITNGSGGSTLLDVDLPASTTFDMLLPEGGILSDDDPFISTATNVTAMTLFFT